jgi:hypothetical protein
LKKKTVLMKLPKTIFAKSYKEDFGPRNKKPKSLPWPVRNMASHGWASNGLLESST